MVYCFSMIPYNLIELYNVSWNQSLYIYRYLLSCTYIVLASVKQGR